MKQGNTFRAGRKPQNKFSRRLPKQRAAPANGAYGQCKAIIAFAAVASLLAVTACNNTQTPAVVKAPKTEGASRGNFGYDTAFLRKHDAGLVVLSNEGESAHVVVSPKYQAKVFTSTAGGDGKSFGWINYKAFAAAADAHMNAYGGENRFWLGPEGGVFSLFFRKGTEMVFAKWKTPPPVDTEPWKVSMQRENAVHLQKDMKLINYQGAELTIAADREISLLTKDKIAGQIGIELDEDVKAVGYLAANAITNKGKAEWNEKTGAPCIWMLDMFNPSPETTIVIPYKSNGAGSPGKIATTDYFGRIPPDRVKGNNGVLYFKADGKSRGKLGLAPDRAKPVAGSWDAQNGVLTLTMFDVDPTGKYVNQEWKTDKPPFSGDAVNAYNDGPLADGSQMGPFYEIESVSPAAFLKPGAVLTHRHYVFHFTGDRSKLDAIAKKAFGVSLDETEKVF